MKKVDFDDFSGLSTALEYAVLEYTRHYRSSLKQYLATNLPQVTLTPKQWVLDRSKTWPTKSPRVKAIVLLMEEGRLREAMTIAYGPEVGNTFSPNVRKFVPWLTNLDQWESSLFALTITLKGKGY